MVARSGGSVSPDTAYFIARVLSEKGKVEEAHKILKDSLGSQAAFVYRKDAEALLADLEKRLPKEKK